MLSRRDLVTKLAAGTAMAVGAAGIAQASFASTRPQARIRTGAAPSDGQQAATVQPALESAPQVVDSTSQVVNSVPQVVDSGPPIVDSGPPTTLSAPPPWELLHPLAMGSLVAHGWRVAGLTGAVDGSCVLTLQNERGRTNRIHLCRNDGSPCGVVFTQRLDMVVMNGGEADLPTEESFAQAVAEVAHVLAANEGHRRNKPVVTALLPHAERVQLFGGAAQLR